MRGTWIAIDLRAAITRESEARRSEDYCSRRVKKRQLAKLVFGVPAIDRRLAKRLVLTLVLHVQSEVGPLLRQWKYVLVLGLQLRGKHAMKNLKGAIWRRLKKRVEYAMELCTKTQAHTAA